MNLIKFNPIIILLFFLLLGCATSLKLSADSDKIETYISAGEYDQAEILCNEILTENDDDAKVYYYLGIINIHREKYHLTIDYLEKSIRLKPSPEAYKELTKANLQLRRLNSALVNLNELEKLDGNLEHYAELLGSVLSVKAASDSLYEIGIQEYQANRFKDAAGNLEKAFNLNDENYKAEYFMHMARGLTYFQLKGEENYWEAIVEFGEAAVVNPNRGDPYYLMGLCYEKKDSDDFDTPIKEYKKALGLDMEEIYREKALQRLNDLEFRKKKLDAFWGQDK